MDDKLVKIKETTQEEVTNDLTKIYRKNSNEIYCCAGGENKVSVLNLKDLSIQEIPAKTTSYCLQ